MKLVERYLKWLEKQNPALAATIVIVGGVLIAGSLSFGATFGLIRGADVLSTYLDISVAAAGFILMAGVLGLVCICGMWWVVYAEYVDRKKRRR